MTLLEQSGTQTALWRVYGPVCVREQMRVCLLARRSVMM